MRRKLLPFYDERKSKIEMIVLHSVALLPEEVVCMFAKNKVSCHYVIGDDGEIWQLVAQKGRAWHAGVSVWRGKNDINSRSIGIEFCSPSLGQRPFSQKQKDAAVELIGRLIKRYKIKPENLVAHSDIAPTRKADPGKAFFWQELAKEGIGLWYDLDDAMKMSENNVEKLLRIIGYDTTDLVAAAYAFCRRYYPSVIADEGDVWQIEKNVCPVDIKLLEDEKFLQILKATAYKYLRASSTPSSM